MRNTLKQFDELGAQVIGIDPHEAWAAKSILKDVGASTDDLNYPVLMDPSLTVSATYGLPFQMRIHVEVSNRPATFVIDKAGVIRYAKRAKKFNDRPSIKELLSVVKNLK